MTGHRRRSKTVLAVGTLLTLQSALRLFFYYEAVYAGVQLLQPMPPAATMNVVNSVNLALGLVGLVVVPGLLLMTRWGFWGTVALSVLTIVFDGVSSATVSLTAFAGLILPVVFLALLLPRRATILAEGRSP
ncbi:MAG TPA: hypothetical protein VLY21_01040 [Nitrososphaerales archaeon]|nr:hypothetical protein [Nitrososphaerales archaeon]